MDNNLTELRRKLNPARFTAMSGLMAAIVGCILEADFTTPKLIGLCITSDGFLMGQPEGDIGFNAFIGSAADLRSNWERLLVAAELTDAERQLAEARYAMTVKDWRRTRLPIAPVTDQPSQPSPI